LAALLNVTPRERRRTDADLVRDALLGSREALAELLARHWDTAVFLATRVLGSQELACDAAQEAAIAAMTDLGRLRSPERFGAWFCGITLNVARRWLRQLRTELPGLPADQASHAPGPAEIAESADISARVRDAIGALPNGQRDAVRLFYLQGLSHGEVAGELGVSVGAVKSRLHQARAALAPRLAQAIDIPKEKSMPHTSAVEWVDASVSEIRRSEGEDMLRRTYVMILAERDGERQLPIWIGPTEATALALALESAEAPRPFTYKLAADLVDAAGSAISEVRITSLIAQVFYAAVIVRGPSALREVDSRPSDAVNLALVTGAPIRVGSDLFGLATPAECASDLADCPIATAEIAAEAQQLRGERYGSGPTSGRAGGTTEDA
jgi:RNA polymerase sigma factor (sigma-70 family)